MLYNTRGRGMRKLNSLPAKTEQLASKKGDLEGKDICVMFVEQPGN